MELSQNGFPMVSLTSSWRERGRWPIARPSEGRWQIAPGSTASDRSDHGLGAEIPLRAQRHHRKRVGQKREFPVLGLWYNMVQQYITKYSVKLQFPSISLIFFFQRFPSYSGSLQVSQGTRNTFRKDQLENLTRLLQLRDLRVPMALTLTPRCMLLISPLSPIKSH